MANFLTPTTELEAVNTLLAAIGETEIEDVQSYLDNADVELAVRLLAENTRAVQLKGWDFNTEEKVTLAPAADGTITAPTNVTRVVLNECEYQPDVKFSMRGLKLFNRSSNSYTFTSPIIVDLIRNLPFEELPEAARRYVVISSGKQFTEQAVGSDTLSRFTDYALSLAVDALADHEIETGNYNFIAYRRR